MMIPVDHLLCLERLEVRTADAVYGTAIVEKRRPVKLRDWRRYRKATAQAGSARCFVLHPTSVRLVLRRIQLPPKKGMSRKAFNAVFVGVSIHPARA